MKRPQIVAQIKLALDSLQPKAQVILYGSEARGEARPDSDFDLLVLFEEEKNWRRQEDEIRVPLYQIELDNMVNISINAMPRSRWENRPLITPYMRNIQNEGITLYSYQT